MKENKNEKKGIKNFKLNKKSKVIAGAVAGLGLAVVLLAPKGSKTSAANSPMPGTTVTTTTTKTTTTATTATKATTGTAVELETSAPKAAEEAKQDVTEKEETVVEVEKTEAKAEVKEEVEAKEETEEEKEETKEVNDILAIRNANKVSLDDYDKAYNDFYNAYGKTEILGIEKIDSVVYYMLGGSLNDEASEVVPGNYVDNNYDVIMDNMAEARIDIMNYNFQAYEMKKADSKSELNTIKLSSIVSNENKKKTVEYIESLVDTVATGDKKEGKAAFDEFYSIMVYGTNDMRSTEEMEKNPTTEEYDKNKYYELDDLQLFAVKTVYSPLVAVYGGMYGYDFTTYFDDKKSNAVKDLSEVAEAINPLYGRECKQIVLK